MNRCFYCENEGFGWDIPDTCDSCVLLLRNEKYGKRLLRGTLLSKLRGQAPPSEIYANVELFIQNFKK